MTESPYEIPKGFHDLVGAHGGWPVAGHALLHDDPVWRTVPSYHRYPRGAFVLTQVHFAWDDGRIEVDAVEAERATTFGFDYDDGEAVRRTLEGLQQGPAAWDVRVSSDGA